MRISLNELAAMSPQERDAVLDKMAHPATAAKPPRKESILVTVFHLLQNLIPTGRGSR